MSIDIWASATAAHRSLKSVSNPALAGLPEVLCDLLKVQEEAGEVAEATLGMLGQNPRKGVTNGVEKVAKELVDVAQTAVYALQTVLLHHGWTLEQAEWFMADHLAFIAKRANGLTEAERK